MGRGFGQPAKDRIWPRREQGDRDPQGLDRDRSRSRFAQAQVGAIGLAQDLILEKETHQACPIPELISAPAILRKWPSVNKERVSASLGARPYMIIDGTLDECIQKLMLQPESQRHLYEIHTVPQSDLVSKILSGEHVVELERLREFLRK
jgi:hypothetical protein